MREMQGIGAGLGAGHTCDSKHATHNEHSQLMSSSRPSIRPDDWRTRTRIGSLKIPSKSSAPMIHESAFASLARRSGPDHAAAQNGNINT